MSSVSVNRDSYLKIKLGPRCLQDNNKNSQMGDMRDVMSDCSV